VCLHAPFRRRGLLTSDAEKGAVETHIARILPCIQTWPRFFTSAIDAQRWITSVINVENLKFDGVEPDKFKGYVTYNAARKMWEEGKFELSGVPKGWVRKAPSPVGQKIVATSLRSELPACCSSSVFRSSY
jgi:hypothetical protein